MALLGNGKEFDHSFLAGDQLKTSSSQYLAVGLEPTSTSENFTAYLTNAGTATSDTVTARYAMGINQTFASAGSSEVSVRMFGISKAKCASSIAAGAIVAAYEGASTTTFAGHIEAISEANVETTTAFRQSIGRALQAGSTNTVISVMVNPSPLPVA